MKKFLILLLSAVISMTMLGACGAGQSNDSVEAEGDAAKPLSRCGRSLRRPTELLAKLVTPNGSSLTTHRQRGLRNMSEWLIGELQFL